VKVRRTRGDVRQMRNVPLHGCHARIDEIIRAQLAE
jgi:hypothetical protein